MLIMVQLEKIANNAVVTGKVQDGTLTSDIILI